MKTAITIAMLLLMGIGAIIGIFIGLHIAGTPQIIIEMDNPEILKMAMGYHGINKCYVDSEGTFYFIRDDEWCSLYSRGFREWYVQKVEGYQ